MAALKTYRMSYSLRNGRKSWLRRRGPEKRRRRSYEWRRSRERRHRLNRRPSRPQKTLARRKKILPKPRRNICIVRFPRRGYRMKCPLMSWCFNRWMRGSRSNLLHGARYSLRSSRPMVLRSRSPRKCLPGPRRCPDFLQAALREIANKKRTKWVASSLPKKRRRYSDEEIFYRLAKPSKAEESGEESGDNNEGVENSAAGISQSAELQETIS